MTLLYFSFIYQHPTPDNGSVVNGDAPLAGSSGGNVRALTSALQCLVLSLFKTNQELTPYSKDKVALQVLPDAHHPVICKHIVQVTTFNPD